MIQKCGDTTPRWKLHMLLTRLHRLTILLREVSFWGVAPIFHHPSLFWKPLQPSVACAESMMTLRHSDVNRSSIYIRFLSAGLRPGNKSSRQWLHVISSQRRQIPIRRSTYNGAETIQLETKHTMESPSNCLLTLLPLIFLQPFMCLFVFVSTTSTSVLHPPNIVA